MTAPPPLGGAATPLFLPLKVYFKKEIVMESVFNILTELLIYFWSSFVNMAEWPISFPFILTVIAVPVILVVRLLFGVRSAKL